MPSYNVKTTNLSIGGVIIESGGGTDNFITLTIDGELGTVQEGVGGASVFSFSNTTTATLAISQLESSYTARRLNQLAQDQVAAGATEAAANGGAGYEVLVDDFVSREGAFSAEAYFSALPQMVKGPAASNRVFTMKLLQCRGSFLIGTEIP